MQRYAVVSPRCWCGHREAHHLNHVCAACRPGSNMSTVLLDWRHEFRTIDSLPQRLLPIPPRGEVGR